MTNTSENENNNQPRILLYSQRNIYNNFHYRLGLYEFEDIICQIDSVDLLSPHPNKWFKYGTRIANRLATSYGNAVINPGIPKIKIEKIYKLLG